MTDPSWYSVLPPILAIVLAIWTKQVILSLFAGIALTLAIVGLYGVLAYYVAQRRREIGLRLAIGAQRGKILFKKD